MLFDDHLNEHQPALLLLLDSAADGLVVVLPHRAIPGNGAAGDRVTAVAPHRGTLRGNLMTLNSALSAVSPRIFLQNLTDLFVSEPTREILAADSRHRQNRTDQRRRQHEL